MNLMQLKMCERFDADFQPSPPNQMIGVALSTLAQLPTNGLRHPPEGVASGWYVWGGEEFSSADDFFQPVHIQHLGEMLPSIIPYLGLPEGWRFQIAIGHEDVWFDSALLNVD